MTLSYPRDSQTTTAKPDIADDEGDGPKLTMVGFGALHAGEVAHVIERTSPMDGPFVGTCIMCGKTDLTMRDPSLRCDNPKNTPFEEALAAFQEGEI